MTHLLILDEEVEAHGDGDSPERDVQCPPPREFEAKVVVLLVLGPLFDGRVPGAKESTKDANQVCGTTSSDARAA